MTICHVKGDGTLFAMNGEMDTKQIIERRLPLSGEYRVSSVHRVGLENAIGCVCENCGALLVNHAIIVDKMGKEHIVGLDCMKTLIKANSIANLSDYHQYLYEFNTCVKFVALLSNKTLTNLKLSIDDYVVRIKYTDNKGRVYSKSEFINTLKLYQCYDEIEAQKDKNGQIIQRES